jgi:ferredoxin, 2Fe-2S
VSTVQVQPSGVTLEVDDGETIFAAAARHGYSWPTVCGGLGSCRACVLSVVEGGEHLSPIGKWEREGLDEVLVGLHGDPAQYRLACQAKASGDVVVHKPGVVPVTRRSS